MAELIYELRLQAAPFGFSGLLRRAKEKAMTIQEVIDKIGTLWTQAEEIVTRNKGADEWPSEDKQKYDALYSDLAKLREQKRRLELHASVQAELSHSERQTEPNEIHRQPVGESRQTVNHDRDVDYALRAWMLTRHQSGSIRPEWIAAAQRCRVDLNAEKFLVPLPENVPGGSTPNRDGLRRRADMDSWEKRALTVTTTAGGYTIPNEMVRALEEAQLFYGGMRQVATIIRTDTGATLPFPTTNETAVKGRILGINTQATATDPVFGIMNLGAFKYSSDMVLVPEELLQDSGINMPEFLGRALGTRIARITNQHWTTGTGTTQPWGIVPRATARNLGVGTATSFGATNAAIVANFVGIVHAVDPAYRRNATWMMNDAIIAMLAGLTDSTGRPLWAPSLVGGEPDRLLGYPIVVNNDMVSTLANLARSVVFGDLSSYYIREVRDVAVLSSRERFIDFHQTAFLAFGRYDGDLLNAGSNPVVAAVHQT